MCCCIAEVTREQRSCCLFPWLPKPLRKMCLDRICGDIFLLLFFPPPRFPPWLIWLSLPMFQWLSGIHRSLITSSNWCVWYDHLTCFLFFPVRLKENCSVIMHCEARMHRKSPIVFTLLNKISQHTAITVVVEKINTMQQCLCLTEQ